MALDQTIWIYLYELNFVTYGNLDMSKVEQWNRPTVRSNGGPTMRPRINTREIG